MKVSERIGFAEGCIAKLEGAKTDEETAVLLNDLVKTVTPLEKFSKNVEELRKAADEIFEFEGGFASKSENSDQKHVKRRNRGFDVLVEIFNLVKIDIKAKDVVEYEEESAEHDA